MKIQIQLPFLSPSVNSCYYTDRNTFTRHKSKLYREFLERSAACVPAGIKTLSGPLEIEINYFVPDKRRRDIDNMVKPILDMLVKFKVIEDDSQVQRLVLEKYYRQREPETLIQILPSRPN